MKPFLLLLLSASCALAQAYSLTPGGSVDLSAPGAIGATTPAAGTFSSLTSTGALNATTTNGIQFGTTSKIIDNAGEVRIFGGTLTHSMVNIIDATRMAVQAGMIRTWTTSNTLATATSDTGLGRNGSGIVEVNTGTAVSGTSNAGTMAALTFLPIGTATSCTGGTIGTGSKSNAGFVTSNAAATIVITFPFTAPTAWNVIAVNKTAAARPMNMTANSTTTATLSGAPSNNDVISYIAMPY